MKSYGHEGFTYIELLITTAIMGVACISIMQLQQHFFRQVQSMNKMMQSILQLNSRFEYALVDDPLSHYQQDWQH